MKYLEKKFNTPGNSKAFVDNWDSIFGDKEKTERQRQETEPEQPPAKEE